MNIVNEIKATFKNGSVITRLVYVNLAVFLFVRILDAILYMLNIEPMLVEWLALPSDLGTLATRPWTLFTYMFLHYEFLHILFNLLWLYWFGKIFLNYFDEMKLLSNYIIGGLLGGILYVAAYNLFPVFESSQGILMGASAGIIAVVIATALHAPNVQINLLLISQIFGPIKIIWIAIFSVISYIIGMKGLNSGGNIAHLGGVIWGYLFISQLKKGKDITSWLNRILFNIKKSYKQKSKLKVSYRKGQSVKNQTDWQYNRAKKAEKENINIILDKIRKSGYDSLTKKEKEILFKMGPKGGKPN